MSDDSNKEGTGIPSLIHHLRGKSVMLDNDLANLYFVETKAVNRAVKRNLFRFPGDFMFQLTKQEYKTLRYQTGTLKRGRHSKYLLFVFTEHGILMLSSVLKSERAIKVNIHIMRAFVQMRRYSLTTLDLKRKIDELENKYDTQFKLVFNAIRQLIQSSETPSRKRGIGFTSDK